MTRQDEWFDTTYRTFYPQIVRFLDGMLSGRSESSDLAQEVFLRLNREETPPSGEQVRFWLFRVARNLAINELKRIGVREKLRHLIDSLISGPADPFQRLSSKEEWIVVVEGLRGLPEDQRAALLLREWEGMSYEEIASTSQVSVAKVKSDIYRARKTLCGLTTSDRGRRKK